MSELYIDGISLLGPGLENWDKAARILRGEEPYVEGPVKVLPPALLPPTERRRAGTAIRLSMTVGLDAVQDAGADATTLASVFSATGGDCENCHTLLETLASDERMISPTRFHNSVHNAPAGYWSIATGSTAVSTSLCAYDASFAAGLIESAAQSLTSGKPCLLIVFDTPYPEPLNALRPIRLLFGLGLVVSGQRGPNSRAALSLSLCDDATDRMDDPQLEALRGQVPTARCLPVMQTLARGTGGRCVIDYLDNCRLAVEIRA
jgi:hypothetical protein